MATKKNNKVRQGQCNNTNDKAQNGRTTERNNRNNKPYDDNKSLAKAQRNDVGWYFKNEQLLKDACSIQFYTPIGSRTGLKASPLEVVIPAICNIKFIPTVGLSMDNTSAVNQAANYMYSVMRNENSGGTNYDPCDYMMYILSIDAPIMYHSWLKRLYGTMMYYDIENLYAPRGYVAAMNVDYDNIKKNLTQLRNYINQYAMSISTRAIPANIDLFTRHSFLCSNIFKDSETSKGQYYMFNPSGYMRWTEGEDAVPKLEYTKFEKDDKSLFTFDDLVEFGEKLISPILGSQDFGTMSGDTIKAFGNKPGLQQIPLIDENYAVSIGMTPESLLQIHNLNAIASSSLDESTLNVTIDPGINKGTVLFVPKVKAASPYSTTSYVPYQGERYLNTQNVKVEPKDVAEMTRMQLVINPDLTITCGSEIATDVEVFTMVGGNQLQKLAMPLIPYLKIGSAGAGVDFATYIQYTGVASKFDWFPIIYNTANEGEPGVIYNTIGDLANYTVVEASTIERIQKAALYGEFGAPWTR